ncbi:maltose ABC transporter permease MalF [Marinobacter halodurans]|uniref:Maltose/maltodextrin transport system permease protein n=1 Tax=Marinobacter halodurans TaxID=2528979 RepID=A0ABY1ZDR1_9GAMM|nr:maltose ABC transporter permease MalF [Marinobacter halodurans]TBW47530.1 maltose ABC transporter permease MalF [Marinobacter halodurans]
MTRAILKWGVLAVLVGMALYLIVALYAQREFVFAMLFLVLTASAVAVLVSKRLYAHRYIYPAVAGMGLFVIFPLMYAVGIGFTNYSASNLLSFERVQENLLSRTYQSESARYNYDLYKTDAGYVIVLKSDDGELVSEPFELEDGKVPPVEVSPTATAPTGEPLAFRDIIKQRNALGALRLQAPDGRELSMASLRAFATIKPLYEKSGNDTLTNTRTGVTYFPNQDTGFYESADGDKLVPGWTVNAGFDNYKRVITDPSISGPFMQIFVWTLLFSVGTVVFTLVLGLLLANLLQWDQIRGKGFYRTMLILPYAVPAFISILVFKGLFNQNFGEINLVLESLFGIRPDWFSDPSMARTMILIVNTWLGYPYMMLLCMGLLQSIPRDLYEASAMDGAGPINNLMNITFPLILKPLAPLLIASFAFNFNNFVLIALLTGGAPDIIGASTPAGTTDLLVSYTYRIAFQDSGQNFGLAAAIATVIFLVVGALSLINLKLSKIKV